MRNLILPVLALGLLAAPIRAGGLEDFLRRVNVQAQADLDGFRLKVCAQFGVPDLQVRTVLKGVPSPGDAFMVFELGRMTGVPPERVLQTYQTHRGKGWGVIAKELGIKPGSREFHALKRGDFRLGSGEEKHPGKGKGRDKGKKEHQD